MSTQDVEERLEEIRKLAPRGSRADFETAHVRQDELLREVLEAIASHSTDNPAQLAEAALKVFDIEFTRATA